MFIGLLVVSMVTSDYREHSVVFGLPLIARCEYYLDAQAIPPGDDGLFRFPGGLEFRFKRLNLSLRSPF